MKSVALDPGAKEEETSATNAGVEPPEAAAGQAPTPPQALDFRQPKSLEQEVGEMKRLRRFAAAITVFSGVAALALASSAVADPVRNPNSLLLEMNCGGIQSELYVTPAAGHAVMLVNATQNTVTFALTVNDPLNEIGGSFSVPLTAGIPTSLLTECTGTVVGTQAVTFTALSLVTPVTP
ncbi:MAG: hypothetical protein M3327_02340 [Actinomycetota bacterium]|nr:hypothetical protein [Actinomycetota bacterium]